jgi:hypothetical protein
LTGNALGANTFILQHCHDIGARNLFDVRPPNTGEEGYKEPSANIRTKLRDIRKPASPVA